MRNLTDPIFPDIVRTHRDSIDKESQTLFDARTGRAPRPLRPLRELSQRINRRAHELAAAAEKRYQLELEAAIAEGAEPIDAIDTWQPSEQRGLLDQKQG